MKKQRQRSEVEKVNKKQIIMKNNNKIKPHSFRHTPLVHNHNVQTNVFLNVCMYEAIL